MKTRPIRCLKGGTLTLLIIILAYLNIQAQTSHAKLTKEVLNDIFKSIPSPLEISFLIKDLGIPYDPTIVAPTKSIAQYKNSYQKALMLGMYSCDVGYANIYGKGKVAKEYVQAIAHLANGLKVSQHVNVERLRTLALTKGLDSLLVMAFTSLNQMDDYFYKKKLSENTILILTGGWLELLYLTCKADKKSPNELLHNRIGEQKIILEQLLLLLSFYEDTPRIKILMRELTPLQKAYDKVKIDFQYNDPTTKKDDNSVLIIDDNSSTKISFTPENLRQILMITNDIRQKIIQGK